MPNRIQALYVLCIAVVLALLPGNAEVAKTDDKSQTPSQMFDTVKKSHPRLCDLKRSTSEELEEIALRDNLVPDLARRQEMANWSKETRSPSDTALITDTLLEAYSQEPPDWPLVSVALFAAQRGVPDPRVLSVAEELLQSAGSLPDEAMIAVGATPVLLALTGKSENIELLKKATSRAFVGVKVEPGSTEFVGNHRELLCQGALQALFLYAPLDQAIAALMNVRDSYRAEVQGFDGFIRGVADSFLEQLERVSKGENVPLPVPSPPPFSP